MSSSKDLKLKSSFDNLPSLFKKYEAQAKFESILSRNTKLMSTLETGKTLKEIANQRVYSHSTLQAGPSAKYYESINKKNYNFESEKKLLPNSSLSNDLMNNKFIRQDLKEALHVSEHDKSRRNFTTHKTLPLKAKFSYHTSTQSDLNQTLDTAINSYRNHGKRNQGTDTDNRQQYNYFTSIKKVKSKAYAGKLQHQMMKNYKE